MSKIFTTLRKIELIKSTTQNDDHVVICVPAPKPSNK